MEYLWSKGESGIKEVQQHLSLESPISFNAVMTVMNRLHEKGHLAKKPKGRLSIFYPLQTLEQFLDEQTKEVARVLVADFGDFAVSHMIDALEQADPSAIHKLEQKLNEMKSRKQT